jgi:hypothetical protein
MGMYVLMLVTWLFYVAIMHLKEVRDDLHPVATVNGYILLGIGLPLDVLLNVVVGTIVFLDPPREWLLTARLKRYKIQTFGWRSATSWWLCEHLLNQFDEGHC